MTNILQFRKPAQTTEERDTLRQIANSEMPSSMKENFKHIARAQNPIIDYWQHACPGKRMDVVKMDTGKICPDCYRDQFGNYHGRDPAA